MFARELAYGIDELTSMIFLLQRRVSRIQRLQEQMQHDRRGTAPVAQLAQTVVQREGYIKDLGPVNHSSSVWPHRTIAANRRTTQQISP